MFRALGAYPPRLRVFNVRHRSTSFLSELTKTVFPKRQAKFTGWRRFSEKQGGEQKRTEGKTRGRRNPWQVYCDWLERYPVLTKVVTTALLVGGGDVVAQLYIEGAPVLDTRRSCKMIVLGGAVIGPTLHVWYGFLNRVFISPTTGGALLRLAADQGVFGPLFIVVIFTYMLGTDGRINDLPNHLREHWLEATVTNWCLWIPTMFCVFRFVPPNFQVLVVNGVALVWNTYLSWVGHKASSDHN